MLDRLKSGVNNSYNSIKRSIIQISKNEENFELIFHKIIYADGQLTHEKVTNVIDCQSKHTKNKWLTPWLFFLNN